MLIFSSRGCTKILRNPNFAYVIFFENTKHKNSHSETHFGTSLGGTWGECSELPPLFCSGPWWRCALDRALKIQLKGNLLMLIFHRKFRKCQFKPLWAILITDMDKSMSSFQLPCKELTLKMLVATIDAQWEGMGDVESARYEPALLPPCPTIRVLSYSN